MRVFGSQLCESLQCFLQNLAAFAAAAAEVSLF